MGTHFLNSLIQLGTVDSGTTTKKGPRTSMCCASSPTRLTHCIVCREQKCGSLSVCCKQGLTHVHVGIRSQPAVCQHSGSRCMIPFILLVRLRPTYLAKAHLISQDGIAVLHRRAAKDVDNDTAE